MAYPRHLLTQDEEIIREFRPHWRLLVIPIFWSLLGIAAVVAVWIWLDVPAANWVVTGLAVALIIWLAARPFLTWYFTLYVLTTERLIKRWGVISRHGIEIPLENINNVHFSQTPLERVLRSGDLLIESAGEQGQSRFEDIPHPSEFQSRIYRVREDRTLQLSRDGNFDAASQLETLARLHRDGVISDEEYAAKRQKFLDSL